ncbi:hypothetical protein ACOSQ3_014192 [Xanthoceras sorbifolium]
MSLRNHIFLGSESGELGEFDELGLEHDELDGLDGVEPSASTAFDGIPASLTITGNLTSRFSQFQAFNSSNITFIEINNYSVLGFRRRYPFDSSLYPTKIYFSPFSSNFSLN